MSTDQTWIKLSNGVEIELLFEGCCFLGLGQVSCDGVPLRDGTWPLRPRISTPGGLTYDRMELLSAEADAEGFLLRIKLVGAPGVGHPQFDFYRPMFVTELPAEPVEDLLEWRLTPLRQDIEGETWDGFAYSYRFRSESREIHRLLDWATWELGGQAAGNLLVSRTCFSPPEIILDAENRYTTSEEYGKSQDEVAGTYMQMRPRFGAMQCFDYEWNPRGSLLLAWDRPDCINSLVQREAGSPWVQILDEYWFAMSADVELPARWVLFCPAQEGETLAEGRTRWMHCWQWSRDHFGGQVGLPARRAPLMYQVEQSPEIADPDSARVLLERVRDELLPRAADLGFNALFFGPWWECARAADQTQELNDHGHSICAPYDYKFAPEWGGDDLMRSVCDAGRRVGVRAMPWLAAHIAILFPDSPLLATHPDVLAQDIFGGRFSGGYAEIAALDLAGAGGDHWFECVKHCVEEVGVECFFFDSYPNLAALPVNYGDPARRPGLAKLWEVQAWCQERGVDWEIEGDGPFGLGSCGIGGVGTGAGEHEGSFHGNFFTDYAGEKAYTLIDANFRVEEAWIDRGSVTAADYFRSLAVRGPLCANTRPLAPGLWQWVTPEVVAWNRAYARLRDEMDVPRILRDDLGMAWQSRDGSTLIVWSFGAGQLPLPATMSGEDVLSGEEVAAGETLAMQPWSIYRLTR
ncbi:MAG TPA: hypothetical protein VGM19_12780 [Armatimonadota bacterium]|jgi:hypothetical protein